MNRPILFALALFSILTVGNALAQQNPSDNPLLPDAAVTAPPAPAAEITGKQGWITLKSDTRFGNTVLKPGTYYVQHQMIAGSHELSFQQMGDPDLALQYSDEGTVGEPVSARCQIENLSARVKRTTIATVPDGTGRRTIKIEIKGENVAHTL